MITFFLLLAINTFTFILIGYDKKIAKIQQRRISEKKLLTATILGGSIGSGIGMLYFRHKTAKKSFLVKYCSIVIMQIIAGLLSREFIK
jgi:uncharacterized membrane protein YsdA (DUF1294 family)